MAFSFTRIILDETEKKIYYRGVDYANSGKVKIRQIQNNACEAIVQGKDTYQISLGFSRVGSPKFSCACPYFQENKKVVCKHIVAVALVWDRQRNIPDPDNKAIEVLCIPEPTISGRDISKAYNDPLHADLEVLRRATDEMGWTRPHARLPLSPRVCKKSLNSSFDVKKGISELRSWSQRYLFDPYFCAGEMVAGFCELARWVRSQNSTVLCSEGIKIATLLVNYHLELITRMIDDSDGLHEFSQAHVMDFIAELGRQQLSAKDKSELHTLSEKVTDY